jgi:hypothetical protein
MRASREKGHPMNLAARLDRLETAVGIGQRKAVFFIVESIWTPPAERRTTPALPERVSDWLTAQPQLTAQKQSSFAAAWVCPELERAAQAKAQGIPYETNERQVVKPPVVHVLTDEAKGEQLCTN